MRSLTVKEVAALLKLSHRRVYKLIRAGVLPGVKIGRAVRVPEEALRRRLGLPVETHEQ